jgi:glycosyltransferase involved in cell wall biosynthesis
MSISWSPIIDFGGAGRLALDAARPRSIATESAADLILVKVLLLAPGSPELDRGSSDTVARYREGLMSRGHLCEVFGESGRGELRRSLIGTLLRFHPDLVHAHDAWRTGVRLLGLRLPWVVSISGDELDAAQRGDAMSPEVREVFAEASRVLVPTPSAIAAIEALAPAAVGKIDVVPRSAEELPSGGTDLRRSLGIPRSRALILVPGGLRRVKAQDEVLALLPILRERGVDAEIVIAGPDQDPDFAERLRARAAEDPRLRIIPPLSRERMGPSYRNADVVLVPSRAEGMSPVILEAGLLGRPVVARDIAANRELIRHRESGLLFTDQESMARCVLAALAHRATAGAMGVRLAEDLRRRFSREQEIARLLSAYAAA